MTKITFNNKENPFFTSLRKKVNNYFSENNISNCGNRKLYTKSIIQIVSAISLYITLVFFTPGPIIALFLCVILGVNLAALGFNIMHEGAHQSYSKNKFINTIGAYFLNVLGGNTFFWKIKHNINHHTYTNIEGVDSDIDIGPLMRLHKDQKRYFMHKFQHLYCLFLYGLSYLSWVFWDDFVKYFTGKVAAGQHKKLQFKEHVIFWTTKVVYIGLYLVLPILLLGWLKALVGFVVITFVCGMTIAVIFQLAHVVEGTNFPNPEANRIDQEWAIHQIQTTANFATGSRALSWLLGGLNFQVEHHLFPRVSHVHYPGINKLVKETCEEFNITYLEYKTIFKAINSHFAHLKQMGKA